MRIKSQIAMAILSCAFSCSAIRAAEQYQFKGGYPTPETIQKAYDNADLSRAIEAYKFLYPTISCLEVFRATTLPESSTTRAAEFFKQLPAKVGSPTSASTGRKVRPSMAHGGQAISKKFNNSNER